MDNSPYITSRRSIIHCYTSGHSDEVPHQDDHSLTLFNPVFVLAGFPFSKAWQDIGHLGVLSSRDQDSASFLLNSLLQEISVCL